MKRLAIAQGFLRPQVNTSGSPRRVCPPPPVPDGPPRVGALAAGCREGAGLGHPPVGSVLTHRRSFSHELGAVAPSR